MVRTRRRTARERLADAQGDPLANNSDLGAGDVRRIDAERLGHAMTAAALLENACRMASDARALILAAGVAADNPAHVYASQAVDAALKAKRSTDYVVKVLKR